MATLKEFKEFAIKGNAIDLAVGIVIGAGFNAVVSALVDNVIMPPLGLLVGGADLSSRELILRAGTESSEAVAIGYGVLINALVEFIIIAFAIFLVVRYINKLKRKEAPEKVKPKRMCSYCQEPIAEKASRCPHCTAELSASNS